MKTKFTFPVRGRSLPGSGRPQRVVAVAFFALLLVNLALAASAPQVIGPADDPYVIDQPTGQIPSTPLVFEKASALTTPVSSISIGQIDPSLFPRICVYVDALGANGVPVGQLPADSFCVYQDTARLGSFTLQELTSDSCRTATCLVIDVSGSMASGGKLTAAKDAAKRYVRNMNIYDRTAIVKFSDCYTVVRNFTSDTTLLISAINGLSANGRTAYFDGVWRGVGLTTVELGSKAVIALTDGMENNSQSCGNSSTPNGLGDGFANDSVKIVSLALGAGIPIYNVSLGSDFDPQYCIKLSNATGGLHYHAPTAAQLDSIYDAIKFRLCSRYLICYDSPDTVQNGDCHNVIVCHRNGNNTCSPCDTGSYCEKAPPVITRTPATIALDNTCQRWGTTVQLSAYVTDRDTPLSQLTVSLFYRNSNTSPYTSVSMTRTDSLFCASVPSSQLLCGGDSIQYYITASDGERTVASPATAPVGHWAFPICTNHAPVCSAPGDTTITQCTPAQVCLPVSATDTDNNLQGCTKTSGPGTLSGGLWCYTPAGSETVGVTVRCADSCGLYCEKTFNVTFAVNDPPVCSAPNDTTIFQCTPTQVCLPVSATDPNGNLTGCTITNGPGTLSGGNWCYTPTGDQTVDVTVRCTDACGAYCEKTFHVTFDINDAPVCSAPNDTTFFQCVATQVCLPVSATDANGNLTGCAITNGPGTLSGGNWCYTPTGDQTVTVTVRCTDACSATCEKTFHVTFDINDAPVCSVPRDTTIFQCAPVQVSLPVSATDANGNLTGCSITNGPGTLSGGNWSYTPTGDQTVDVTVRCTDACGAYCEKTFHVTFDLNDAPVCSVPRDTTIFQCAAAQVCLPVSATDANGNLTGCSITNGPGTLSGGLWCYTPTGEQTVAVTVRCTDACGAYCEKTFHVTFDLNDAPVCSVPRDTTIFQCAPTQVCLPVSATDANGNLTGCAKTSGPGTLSGGNWCYTPTGDQTVTVTIRCTDACGAYCEKTFHVTFDINDAPVCSVPPDTSFFQCTPTQVCLPVSATDANGNLTGCAITNGPGTLSGGNWCYTPTGDQTVTVTVRCTDACSATCEKTFHVTFDINDAPVCSVPNDTTIFQCAPVQVSLPVSATDANGNLTGCSIINGPGTLSGGNWSYTPTGDQTVTVTVRCTDACAATCEKTFHVTFDLNDTPVCSVPNDTTIFQCAAAQVCLPVSATDANGNLTGCSITNGPGTLSGGLWCYTPTGSGAVNVTIRCTDACGASCEKTFSITFTINDPPVISLGDDVSIPQTVPQVPVCINYTVSDPNGPAGLIESLVSSPAGTTIDTLLNKICFTPSGAGVFLIVAKVQDPCGASDLDTVAVSVFQTSPPVCSIPNDTSVVQCTPTQLCLPVSATSLYPPVNCVIVSGLGTLSGGQWCYTPSGDETVSVTIRCTDALGVTCSGSFQVVFDINDAPVCSVPNDTTIFQCAAAQVCLPVSATDANGNLTGCSLISSPGTLSGGLWCYTPTTDQTVTVTVRCTDACGATCEKTFHVTFDINEAPVCTVPNDTTIFQCTATPVCLPVSATDADNNLAGCQIMSGPGQLNGNWCYTPTGDETVTVTIRCTDACGAYCERTFHVTFDINDPPTISLGNDISVPVSVPPVPICVNYTVSDPNGPAGLVESLVSGPAGATIDTSLNKICFTPGGAGVFVIVAKVQDPCGASDLSSDLDTVAVSVYQTAPPVCLIPNDTSVVQCTPTQLCLPVSATSLYPPVNCVIVSGLGTLSGGQWCYTPSGDETVNVTIQCTDALGATCSGSFQVVFDINDAPVCSVPRDTTIFQCAAAQVCLPVSATDANGNLTGCSLISSPGTLSGGLWCYTPTGDQTVTVTVRCTDVCAAICEKTFHVTFDINEAPVCTVPNDTTIFQCTPTPVCLPVSATDADGNLTGCALVGSPGTLNGNWCYTPTGSGTVAVTVRCTDACGAFCEKTFHVTFHINVAPVCSLPRDTTIFQCTASQVCLPVSATDADGNLTGCTKTAGPGTLNGGNWCYTPSGSGTQTVTIRCADACGAFCEGTFHVTFNLGQPPQITCPGNQNVTCASLVPACNPSDAIVTGGAGHVTVTCGSSNNGGTGCASSPLIYTYTYTATDSCGATAQCQRTITVIDNVRPTLAGCPVNATIQCSDAVPPAANVTATDNCDPSPTIAFLETVSLTGCGGYTGTITRRWIATDRCGNADTCTQVITKADTQAPVCNIPSGPFNFFECTHQQISIPVSATDNCDPSPMCWNTSSQGTVTNGYWVYQTWRTESFTVNIRCADDCSNTCQSSFVVNIVMNDPPTISLGPDQSIFRCDTIPVCVYYIVADPNSLNGSTESLVSGPPGATIDPPNNRVCFVAASGTYQIIVRIADSCGATAMDTANVQLSLNSPPAIAFGNDTTVFQCAPASCCVNYTVSDPNGLAGSSETLVSGPPGATFNPGANYVCFTPAGSGMNTIIVKITDTCGVSDQDTVKVNVVQNSPPVCSVPHDTTIFQCTATQVCLPVSGTDPDGGQVICQKVGGLGQLSNGNWCYTPTGDQTVPVTIRCTDTCGAFCEKSFNVTFNVNNPPVCSVPDDQVIRQVCGPQQVELPVIGSDADGNLTGCQIVSGPGQLVNGQWVYTPSGSEQFSVSVRCTDTCGASCEKSFYLVFDVGDSCSCKALISIGDNDGTFNVLNGESVTMPVNIDALSEDTQIGGFDLLICYDPSVLIFQRALIGTALDTLKWEYFTYRHGSNGNCESGCPSGYIRLVGIANLDNGVSPPSAAYRPIGEIAAMSFNLSPNRNLIGQCIPINFCWLDCGDNTVSSRDGKTTLMSLIIDSILPQANCLKGGGDTTKPKPILGLCLSGGWICVREPLDDRGDINQNGVANEISDAVLFSNYFIYGIDATFAPPGDRREAQKLATDVNDDGIVLTVADLVYLIRIITGDAQPYPAGENPKLTPYPGQADAIVNVGSDRVSVTANSPVDLGGAVFTFRYSGLTVGTPVLGDAASQMVIKSKADRGELRILVAPMMNVKGARISAGVSEILSIPTEGHGTIELADVQMADARGTLLSSSVSRAVPAEYALLQNYPNPFNAGTVIRFSLKEGTDWTLNVYNITGQTVRSFSGNGQGQVQVAWDGSDGHGRPIASGVYFYRLETKNFTATKKMVLMK